MSRDRQPVWVSLFLLAAVVGVVAVLYWRHTVEREKEERARAACNRWADELDARLGKDGSYLRWDGPPPADPDPWGNPLRVHYFPGITGESLRVHSAGPDGVFDTRDDIKASRTSTTVGSVVAGAAGAAAARATDRAIDRAADGVKKLFGRGSTGKEAGPKGP